MTLRIDLVLFSGLALTLTTGLANAHVGVSSGPGFAGTNQLVTFSVGHGCEGSDTRKVRIEIPPEVVSVRAVNSNLGPASVELDDAELVSAVTWEKLSSEVLEADTNYYSVTLRLGIPDLAFSTLYFPAYQTCETSDGELLEVPWTATVPEAEVPEGEEPAPALTILPKRVPGWNKLSVPAAIADLSAFFSDAVIVWKDDAAYSPNEYTSQQIAKTSGVTALTSLDAADEIWVKY